jgi:bifunctional non-homologous end joining protein LigD
MRISPDGTTRLTSRNNNGFSARFPKLAGALGDTLGGRAAVLDGEIVALNELGQPDFGLLQNRAAAAAPVSYFVFDVLQLGDVQLLDEPYDRRREVLEQLKPPDKNLVAITPAYSHADLSAAASMPASASNWRISWSAWSSIATARCATARGSPRLAANSDAACCVWPNR